MSRLHRALHPWQEPLADLSEAAVTALGPMVGRLAALVGPMLHHPSAGGESPDGIGGLARTGPWDRLLTTEWALADEAPLEFLRRATSGEQLFRELSHVCARAGRRCCVLVDSGPEQLGAPRLVQLALLVVLERRAAQAAAELWWASLQQDHAWRRGLGGAEADRLLATRSLLDATQRCLDRITAEPGEEDEIWLVGGARALSLQHPGARRVHIEEDAEGALMVALLAPGGASRSVRLTRPADATCRQVFARPSTSSGPPPLARPRQRQLQSPMLPGFRFSHQGTRLVGACADGSIVGVRAWADGGTGRDRRPKLAYLPTNQHLVALAWRDGHPLVLSTDGDRLWLSGGAIHRSAPCAVGASPPESLGDLVHVVRDSREGRVQEVWFTDASGWLHQWSYTSEQQPIDTAQVGLALGNRDGRLLSVVATERSTVVTLHQNPRPHVAARHELQGVADQAFVGPRSTHGSGGLLAVRIRLRWHLLWEESPHDVAPIVIDGADLHQVRGVSWLSRGGEHVPCLVEVDTDSQLNVVSRDFRRRLDTEGPVAWACASSGARPCVAWLEQATDRLVVYDLDRDLALLVLTPRYP